MIGGVLIGVLALVVAILILLFILPLSLVVDTEKSLFYLKWSFVFTLQLFADESGWRWGGRLFNRPLNLSAGSAKKRKSKSPASKKSSSANFFTLARLKALVRNMRWAIRVKQCRLNWDTGDFATNAQLYPLCSIFGRGPVRLNINFMGQQELIIRLQTRLYRLVYAGLRVYFS